MPAYEFVTVDVFTDRRFGGNPLAVFPDARGLTDEQMQALAMEFNLSETTFVLPPTIRSIMRRCASSRRAPSCRSPAIPMSAPAMCWRNATTIRRSIMCSRNSPGWCACTSCVRATRSAARAFRRRGRCRSTSASRMTLSRRVPAWPRTISRPARMHHWSLRSGTPFVIAEIASVEALSRASPDIGAFRLAAERFPEVATRFSLLLYARRNGDATRLAARMFAPLGGIMEDPATGSANAALAALLTSLAPGENADLSYESCKAWRWAARARSSPRRARRRRDRCWRRWREVACRCCGERGAITPGPCRAGFAPVRQLVPALRMDARRAPP